MPYRHVDGCCGVLGHWFCLRAVGPNSAFCRRAKKIWLEFQQPIWAKPHHPDHQSSSPWIQTMDLHALQIALDWDYCSLLLQVQLAEVIYFAWIGICFLMSLCYWLSLGRISSTSTELIICGLLSLCTSSELCGGLASTPPLKAHLWEWIWLLFLASKEVVWSFGVLGKSQISWVGNVLRHVLCRNMTWHWQHIWELGALNAQYYGMYELILLFCWTLTQRVDCGF